MRTYVWPILSLAAAASVQGNIPPWLTVWGVKPDLILVVLIAYALAADLVVGAALGFVAGLIQGSIVGLGVGTFIVTRTVTGFLAGLVTTKLFGENPIVPVFSAAWLTIACEGLFFLANPRVGISIAARSVAVESVYNAFLTFLLFWILRRLESRRKVKLANARI